MRESDDYERDDETGKIVVKRDDYKRKDRLPVRPVYVKRAILITK